MPRLPDVSNWAITACAEAALGAVRRPPRLVALAALLAHHPRATLPEACGHGAMRQGASRFLAHDGIAPQDLLQSHTEAPYGRLAHVLVGLAVQETTAIAWTSHRATTGLGPLGPHACQGLLVPRTLALTPARVPLGVLAPQVWARDPAATGKQARRTQRPMAQQASQPWRSRLEAVRPAQASGPTTRCVRVGDREAAVDALLAAARPAGVDRLLRASWHRWVPTPQRSGWETLAAQPVVAQLPVPGPRRGPPPARAATLARRLCLLPLRPPRHRPTAGVPEVGRWAVPGWEEVPPAAVEPIAGWRLTTVAVEPVPDALERVKGSVCRWGMAVWHRSVQSGGRSEARQRETAARVQRCLALSSVMAGRLF